MKPADRVDSFSTWHGPLLFLAAILGLVAVGVGAAALFGAPPHHPAAVYVMGVASVFIAAIVFTNATLNLIFQSTIKVGYHDPDNPMCRCGSCEAYGRWLMRPLPAEPSRHEEATWFDSITADCTRHERMMLSAYLSNSKADTADFLSAWEAAQHPHKPANDRDMVVKVHRQGRHRTQASRRWLDGEHDRLTAMIKNLNERTNR